MHNLSYKLPVNKKYEEKKMKKRGMFLIFLSVRCSYLDCERANLFELSLLKRKGNKIATTSIMQYIKIREQNGSDDEGRVRERGDEELGRGGLEGGTQNRAVFTIIAWQETSYSRFLC